MRLQPLEPRRVRYPRGAYGWVDLKVVTSGVLERIGSEAALTYLFLCAVGNLQGLSCWSTWRIARVVGLALDHVEAALKTLSESDLIATNGRVIQVLPLESTVTHSKAFNQMAPAKADGSPGRILPKVQTTSTDSVTQQHRESPCEPALSADEITACEEQARAQIARFQGRREPRPGVVHAVARSLALKARKARSL